MKSLFGIFAFLLASSSFARDPLGEVANYKLDKARVRTTSTVKSGITIATVAKKITNNDGSISYDVNINYNIDVTIVGRQTGTEVVRFPAEFFTEEFLVKLRQTKLLKALTSKSITKDLQTQNPWKEKPIQTATNFSFTILNARKESTTSSQPLQTPCILLDTSLLKTKSIIWNYAHMSFMAFRFLAA